MMEQASDNIVDIRYEQTGAATATNEPGMQKSKDSYFGDEFEEKMKQWRREIEEDIQKKRIAAQIEKSIKKRKKASKVSKPIQLPKWLSKRMKGKGNGKKKIRKTPKPVVWIRDEAEEQERKRRFQRNQEKEKLRQEKKEALLQEALSQSATKINVKKKKKKGLKQKQVKKMPWVKIIYTPMGGQNKRY